jgi:hypothetical protein
MPIENFLEVLIGKEPPALSKFADVFERSHEKFGNWIEKNNEAIFDAFVGRVVKILNDNPKISLIEFVRFLMPKGAILVRPMSFEEQHAMMKALSEFSSAISRDRGTNSFPIARAIPKYIFPEQDRRIAQKK